MINRPGLLAPISTDQGNLPVLSKPTDYGPLEGVDSVNEDARTSQGSLASHRSCEGEEDEREVASDPGFAQESNSFRRTRARRNLRIQKLSVLALGTFRVAGLNRLRAKELSAAEVKRGLRSNRPGAGQNQIIPTMSFYSPKNAAEKPPSTEDQYKEHCDQYARFCPAIVQRTLHRNLCATGVSTPSPGCEHFRSSLFFADISGFTRLSARLNAEQLKTHTNEYFTRMIDVVARCGGDIIKFCGDAVMILWPCELDAPQAMLQANAIMAAKCSLVMLQECGKYDVGKGSEAVSLRLHCGIGYGTLYGYCVGAEGRWEYLIAGDPLRQIGEAEPEAKQGQVIVSPEVWSLIGKHFTAVKTPLGNHLLKEMRGEGETKFKRYTGAPKSRGNASLGSQESFRNGGARSPSSPGHSTGGGDQHGVTLDRTGTGIQRRSSSTMGGAAADLSLSATVGAQSPSSPSLKRGSDNEMGRRKRSFKPAGRGGTGGTLAERRSCSREGSSGLFVRTSLDSTGGAPDPLGSRSDSDEDAVPIQRLQSEREIHSLAQEFLGDYIEAQYGGKASLEMSSLSEALRGYTQESARYAFESSTVDYLAELRKVSTIFINIRGLEDALMQGALFYVQQAMEVGVSGLAGFGGVLRQFIVDDKGCVMIGAFGLPQYSYEDNEARAISASEAILKALNGLNLSASIGITAGNVYCGLVGAEKRCEYAMMGCSVNLSARLMASAPINTIQVDDQVFQRAAKYFNFTKLEPIKAKGYVDPVPVFRPTGQIIPDGPNAGGGIETDLVGAKNELSALVALAKRMADGTPTRPVILLGQAGSGKTHLLQSSHVRQLCLRHDMRSLTTVSRNVHTSTPFYIWRSVFAKIFGLDGGASDLNASGGVAAQLSVGDDFAGDPDCEPGQVGSGAVSQVRFWMREYAPDVVQLIPLLEPILSIGMEQTVATSTLDPEMQHQALERLVIEVMKGASKEKPFMLVVENAQWVDVRSMQLLRKVARAQLSIMMVISARPLEEYFETIPQEFISLREMGTTVEMKPFDEEQCVELAHLVLGEQLLAQHPDALPPNLGKLLLEKSGGGNPLFVRNIASTVKEELLTTGMVSHLQELPASFCHDLIVSRFDALEPMEQTVLKAATVIGTMFSMQLLLHMFPHVVRDKRGQLHMALLKLIEANFISRTVVGKTERFNFVHSSVQETIYRMMLTDQREQLHEICAAWYEEHYKNSTTYMSLIMHHWLRSSNTHKKVHYLEAAAHHAREVFANEEAARHLAELVGLAFGKDASRAAVVSLRSVSRPPMPMPMPMQGGVTLTHRWRSLTKVFGQEGREESQELEELEGWPFSTGHLSEKERRGLWRKSRSWLPASAFAVCTDFSDTSIFSTTRVGHWIGEAGIGFHALGRLSLAYNCMQEALVYLGFPAIPSGRGSRTAALIRAQLRKAHAADDSNVLMAARLYEGIVSICLKTGHIRSIGFVNRVTALSTQGNAAFLKSSERACLLAHWAMEDLFMRKHRVSGSHLHQARDLAQEMKCSNTQAVVHLRSGSYNAMQGLWEEAEAELGQAFELFAPLGDTSRCGEVMIESAYVKLCTGDLTEALSMFQEVSDMAKRRMDRFLATVSLLGAALVLAVMGRPVEVKAVLEECHKAIGSEAHKQRTLLESVRAYLLVFEGKYEEAMKSATLAVRHFVHDCNVWFSVGFFMHLLADALFTMVEYNLAPHPEQPRRLIPPLLRALKKIGKIFDVMTPLVQLAQVRLHLLNGRDRAAEAAVDLGLQSEELIQFPFAEGLLLLHSTRLQCLPEEERRARAREARKALSGMHVTLISRNHEKAAATGGS